MSTARQLRVGTTEAGWALTRPERSLLVMGHPGTPARPPPCWCLSCCPPTPRWWQPAPKKTTCSPPRRATAMVRALQGQLWHFAPDGVEPTPPGCHQLHWSPVTASVEGRRRHHRRSDDRRCRCHLGLAQDHGRRRVLVHPGWVFAGATAARRCPGRPGHAHGDGLGDVAPARGGNQDPRGFAETPGVSRHPDGPEPADRCHPHRRGRDLRLLGSASAALSPYWREAALAVTDRPNFSLEEFCWFRTHSDGAPSFDTLYINSSGQQQERLAPLIVALINQIKEACYAWHRRIQSASPGAYLPPVILALDKTANIAPLPDLPSIVSQGGSRAWWWSPCSSTSARPAHAGVRKGTAFSPTSRNG